MATGAVGPGRYDRPISGESRTAAAPTSGPEQPAPPHTASPPPGDRPGPTGGGRAAGPPGAVDEPLATLRGAGVSVSARRAGRVAMALCAAALLAAAVVLFVAGARKNAQITDLSRHGVRTEATVTQCLGLLGGSGSNAAGYACQGTLTFEGRRYAVTLPGTAQHPPGAAVTVVVAADDPRLVASPDAVAAQHASWRVFVAPVVLAVAALALGAVLVVGWRRTARR